MAMASANFDIMKLPKTTHHPPIAAFGGRRCAEISSAISELIYAHVVYEAYTILLPSRRHVQLQQFSAGSPINFLTTTRAMRPAAFFRRGMTIASAAICIAYHDIHIIDVAIPGEPLENSRWRKAPSDYSRQCPSENQLGLFSKWRALVVRRGDHVASSAKHDDMLMTCPPPSAMLREQRSLDIYDHLRGVI